MRQVLLSFSVPPHHWVQHNLPWLAVLAVVFGFDRDDAALSEQRRDEQAN